MDTTQPAMPMGQTARLPLDMADMMGPVSAPAATAPPAAAAGLMDIPAQGSDPGSAPTADPHDNAPYNVVMQADGSSIYTSKTNPPVVIGVNPPPKLPKALQPDQGAK